MVPAIRRGQGWFLNEHTTVITGSYQKNEIGQPPYSPVVAGSLDDTGWTGSAFEAKLGQRTGPHGST